MPRIAAVALAAGRSTRMGTNKMLAEIGGKPMLAHTVDAALEAGLDPVVVVTGHQADEVEAALPPRDVLTVHNPDFVAGMAGSITCGLAALPEDVDAAFILLADMPRVTAAHLTRLAAAFAPDEGRAICVPVHGGKRGNPVLFAREFFDEIMAITGDQGAKRLLADHAERVVEVAMDDDAVLEDADTPEELARLG
jgi:molybdenum cofactor cytidylyltransferase